MEVTIALGVLAFAGIAILGLLPTALNSLQAASFDTLAARISAQVKADLQQVELEGSGAGVRFYNMEGSEVSSGDPGAVFQAYRSEATQPLPGTTPPRLRRVSVQVVYNPAGHLLSVDGDGWANMPASMPSKIFRFYVTR